MKNKSTVKFVSMFEEVMFSSKLSRETKKIINVKGKHGYQNYGKQGTQINVLLLIFPLNKI